MKFWPSDWCLIAAGAILATYSWGHCSAWWVLATIPLGFLSGFLRGMATASAKKAKP